MTKTSINRVFRKTADFILDKSKDMMLNSRSPVKGEPVYKKLSKEYAAQKGGGRNANLLLDGDFQDGMRVRRDKARLIHTYLNKEQKKADNHNRGVTLPKRQSIPEGKQTYKDEVIRGIKKIIKDEQK